MSMKMNNYRDHDQRAKKRMSGEDVYGRRITVSAPHETPHYLSIRKNAASTFNRRQESPSPHRHRQRQNSGSYNQGYDQCPQGGQGKNLQQDLNWQQLLGAGSGYSNYQNQSRTNQKMQFIPAQPEHNSKTYKTPGGPVKQNGSSGNQVNSKGLGSSTSQTYTLPNSNSERYYCKSSPTSEKTAPNLNEEASLSVASPTSSNTNSSPTTIPPTTIPSTDYVTEDIRAATSGQNGPILVFKPSGSSTKIPIPTFDFRGIPPPSLSSSTIDPIKLIESTSKESMTFINQLNSKDRPSRATRQQSNGRSTSESHDDNGSHSVMPSQSQSYTGVMQRRGKSAPTVGRDSDGGVASDDQICIMHGYPPPSSNVCHSNDTDLFKKPASPSSHSSKIQNKPHYNSSDSHANPIGDGKQSYSPQEERQIPNHQRNSLQKPQMMADACSSNGTNDISQTAPIFPFYRQQRTQNPGSRIYRVPTPNNMDPSTDFYDKDFNERTDSYSELVVSNLDYTIDPREWSKIIYATFYPHFKILSIQVRLQADNTSVASVRLPTEQKARQAIAQFHRRKIGYKRIAVQLKSDLSQSPADSLRADTIALLMEAKDNKMALSRLIDLFDSRFHKTVSVSDIYKMRDTIQIIESGGAGRWVKLMPGVRCTTAQTQPTDYDFQTGEMPEYPVCTIHCPEGSLEHTESINACMLPGVRIRRKQFSPQIHSLLLSHNGYIPLMSFPVCYRAEFHPLPELKEGGIPLEHVISCVPGVEITVSKAGFKVIQFQENRDQFGDMMKNSQWQELGKISREVMELLRTQPTCTMPVSKFIPAYHHHFGHQCRVADYGYTKLQDLFESIPHAIQILGTGDRKTITLSPRAQLKRFTTDIIKVVKGSPGKQCMLDEFPNAYARVMQKPLFLPHYGVSFVEDVLMDIPTTSLIVIEECNHTLLAVPRREQTPEEVERTKQFALEVVDLLRHHSQCSMAFNKFIPAYHHHFGRQCRVADYGFAKLTDLFEAIAYASEIDEEGDEKVIKLTQPELRKVVCEQLSTLIRERGGTVLLEHLLNAFAQRYSYTLKLEDFGVDSIRDLVYKFRNNFKLDNRCGQDHVELVTEVHITVLGLQVMQLLMDETGGSLPLVELCSRYEGLYKTRCDVGQLREDLMDFVQIDDPESDSGGVIRLTSQQMLGRNLRLLLLHHERVVMSDLAAIYRENFGVELSPALYGFQTLYQLLLSFPHILEVRGKPHQKYIILSETLNVPRCLPPARVDVTSPPHKTVSPSALEAINPALKMSVAPMHEVLAPMSKLGPMSKLVGPLTNVVAPMVEGVTLKQETVAQMHETVGPTRVAVIPKQLSVAPMQASVAPLVSVAPTQVTVGQTEEVTREAVSTSCNQLPQVTQIFDQMAKQMSEISMNSDQNTVESRCLQNAPQTPPDLPLAWQKKVAQIQANTATSELTNVLKGSSQLENGKVRIMKRIPGEEENGSESCTSEPMDINSSNTSITAAPSPVKRKSRIAANFPNKNSL